MSVPALSGEQSLNRYLAEIKKFPVLTAEQEYMLAKRYQEHEDPEAAAQLVTSHLRLVAKIAMGYRGYGLPVSDLISEGNVGLMQGVKKFEPDRGFRLATYAMWWIKASIQEFILRSWSLVKMGTTAAQKKLFFNLRRMKKQLDAYEDSDLHPDDVAKLDAGDYANVRAVAYDVVLNGYELGGGSIRIHEKDLQAKMFEVLGVGPEEQQIKFGHILDAFRFGAPPHGGLALGLDRIAMIAAGEDSIREVIAFPKNNKGADLMAQSPCEIGFKELREVYVQSTWKDPKLAKEKAVAESQAPA